jgi:hypothetical protein
VAVSAGGVSGAAGDAALLASGIREGQSASPLLSADAARVLAQQEPSPASAL